MLYTITKKRFTFYVKISLQEIFIYQGRSLAIFQAINRFSCAKNMNIEQSCLEDFEIHYRNGNRNNDTRFYHNPYTNNNII